MTSLALLIARTLLRLRVAPTVIAGACLFIVGMLSMLGVILETPLENVVEKLHIPEAISQALLKHDGIYGPFLELAVACENCDAQRLRNR